MPPAPDTTPNSVEAEVRDNILAQTLVPGCREAGTAAALDLPAPFVTRIADRIIRSTFEERHRNVYDDQPGRASTPANAVITVDREQWPPLRGYRPGAAPGDNSWPRFFPGSDAPPELRRAAEHISSHLASGGLMRTLADACDILSPLVRTAHTDKRILELLQQAGFPVDLLDSFSIDSRPVLERVISRLSSGTPQPSIAAEVAGAKFEFHQTRRGFRAIDDAGSQPVSLIRMQMTRPDHWDGIGGGPKSGDNLDLLLHLLRSFPSMRFVLSVHADHADALSASLAAAGANSSNVTVIPAELPVSQWAQDNLKPGVIDGTPDPVALLPRYASRAEDGAKLDPGDTAALSNLAAAGITPIHSPLHFQGGNVMLLRGTNGEQLLLVGEAEIARNVALGLTPEQAGEALRIEMGADALLVLPAVGFHLDTELTARTVGAQTIIFVPDNDAAARIILRAAIRAMGAARVLSHSDSKVLQTFLEMKNDEAFVAKFGAVLGRVADASGNLPSSFTSIFHTGPHDPDVANAHRVLAAFDTIISRLNLPWEASMHPHAQAYLRSLRRSATDRAMLNDQLSSAGLRVVPVPSLSAGNRSASIINAIQLPDRVLVPVRGGFLKPLDDAAINALRRHLPANVAITPIPTAESERRGGALHCSIAAFPSS